jgi:F-type H+-transporting ATPase subunit a
MDCSRYNYLKINILAFLLTFTSIFSFAQHEHHTDTSEHQNQTKEIEHGEKEEEFNFSEMILHHISDSHEWHFATIGHTHITLPLPVILYSKDRGIEVFSSHAFHSEGEHAEGEKEEHVYNGYYIDEETHKIMPVDKNRVIYDFSITKNVASMFLSLILLCVVFIGIANSYKKNPGEAPKGIQSLFEPLIIFIRDEVVKPNIGEHHYQKFLPYMLTLFFFIWFNNLLGLLPGGANLTGNIAVTLVLACLTLFLTLFNAKGDYWKHIFTPHVPAWLYPIMIPVEILGVFTKPMALTVRLFANITGGHIVILSFVGLIFLFKNAFVAGAAIPLVIAMNFLELLVAFLQAYIFTLLSSMYIGSAVEEHGESDFGH